MNLIDFLQPGGFRFKQATLGKMQAAYFEILKAFVRYFGMPDVGNFIISGCTIVGGDITAGMLFIDGELCSFAGSPGTLATTIKKEVSFENLAFKNGTNPPVFRATQAIVDATGVALSAFVRIPSVKEMIWGNIGGIPDGLIIDPNVGTENPSLIARIVELEKKNSVFQDGGAMVFWNKIASLIPVGWAEVEDWRGRMPIGWDPDDEIFDTMGETGGAKSASLTIPVEGYVPGLNTSAGEGGRLIVSTGVAENGESFESVAKVATAPTTGSVDHMNPYRVVIFIEYVG
ncbi:hypothetical protein [Flavobacterium sp. AED]|uniref:hypothetical protein n=1 Tax=Flavobacterium sp. AED TaxID=1423323 RepID=UPI00057EB655|nr:hypothetical protein [Flavobacterium sp. AED]KIA86576.1 hypothetical protein OA85_02675 [Flavobacterium sp. AED]